MIQDYINNAQAVSLAVEDIGKTLIQNNQENFASWSGAREET